METKEDIFEYHEKWLNPKTKRYSGHVYTLNGVPLKGVTTVLKVIAKDNLIQWAADETAGYLGWKNPKKFSAKECTDWLEESFKAIQHMTPALFLEKLSAARVAHTAKKEKGADLGTIAHKMVEMYALRKINKTDNEITLAEALKQVAEDEKDIVLNDQEKKDVLEMFGQFVAWADNNDVEFLESEKKMYSKEHWIAGTCDLLIRWNGKKMVGDVKTMSKIWDRTPFFQANGAYRIMLEERGHNDIEGALIIRIAKPKEVRDSQSTKYPIEPFEVMPSYDAETDKKGFLAALALTQALETFDK